MEATALPLTWLTSTLCIHFDDTGPLVQYSVYDVWVQFHGMCIKQEFVL